VSDDDGVKRTFRIEVLEYLPDSNNVWIPRFKVSTTAESVLGALQGATDSATAKAQLAASESETPKGVLRPRAIDRYLRPTSASE